MRGARSEETGPREYYDDVEQCICIHAADSALMGWNPTSQDQENDVKMAAWCAVTPDTRGVPTA